MTSQLTVREFFFFSPLSFLSLQRTALLQAYALFPPLYLRTGSHGRRENRRQRGGKGLVHMRPYILHHTSYFSSLFSPSPSPSPSLSFPLSASLCNVRSLSTGRAVMSRRSVRLTTERTGSHSVGGCLWTWSIFFLSYHCFSPSKLSSSPYTQFRNGEGKHVRCTHSSESISSSCKTTSRGDVSRFGVGSDTLARPLVSFFPTSFPLARSASLSHTIQNIYPDHQRSLQPLPL